jgi:addiction module RelE/StbE family toxin
MDREITWSVSASDDLVAVAEHISRDSESYAATVVRELVAATRTLRVFAERGRRAPEYNDPSVRELIVRKYRLVYRIRPERIEVLRIIHGAREMPPVV